MTNENFRNNLDSIQETIGYEFNNWHLLQQAFIRRSFSKENGGENNEVLEFIGDKVLDFVVVKILDDEYGSITDGDWEEYHSEYNEGKLTEFKKKLVDKTMLAHRIDILGLNDFLLMGKGDIKQNVQEEPSVMEDLFEAIIGAVAIDSNYNMKAIEDVVIAMLDPLRYLYNDFDMDVLNYVAEVQHWQQCHDGSIPEYYYWENYDGGYTCRIQITNPENSWYRHTIEFEAEGTNKAEARMNAAENAYDYLDDNGYLNQDEDFEDIVGEPDYDTAVEQLNTLATKGYIEQPDYDFEETYDNDGNPEWECVCSIEGYDYSFTNSASSKKVAKRDSAYEMLRHICGYDEEGDN